MICSKRVIQIDFDLFNDRIHKPETVQAQIWPGSWIGLGQILAWNPKGQEQIGSDLKG